MVNSQYSRAPCMALGRSRARPMGRETLARVSESGLPDAPKASGIFFHLNTLTRAAERCNKPAFVIDALNG